MGRTVYLRVDLDFRVCVDTGLPFLLHEFERREIGATFFVVMGPDTMGSHKSRIKKKGYIKRLMAMNPFKLAMMAGRAQLRKWNGDTMVWVDPKCLEVAEEKGHELAVHGYDHAWWAEQCWHCEAEHVQEQVDLAMDRFQRHFPGRSLAWGAPNWRCNMAAINVLKGYDIAYCSDTRGNEPFFPCDADGSASSIPQLPISLPCMHELAQLGIQHQDIPQVLVGLLQEGYNQLCMHGYYEGYIARRTLTRFLDLAIESGVSFRPLCEALPRESIPTSALATVQLPGGFSEVSCAESFLQSNYFEQLRQSMGGV